MLIEDQYEKCGLDGRGPSKHSMQRVCYASRSVFIFLDSSTGFCAAQIVRGIFKEMGGLQIYHQCHSFDGHFDSETATIIEKGFFGRRRRRHPLTTKNYVVVVHFG